MPDAPPAEGNGQNAKMNIHRSAFTCFLPALVPVAHLCGRFCACFSAMLDIWVVLTAMGVRLRLKSAHCCLSKWPTALQEKRPLSAQDVSDVQAFMPSTVWALCMLQTCGVVCLVMKSL